MEHLEGVDAGRRRFLRGALMAISGVAAATVIGPTGVAAAATANRKDPGGTVVQRDGALYFQGCSFVDSPVTIEAEQVAITNSYFEVKSDNGYAINVGRPRQGHEQ